MPFPSHRCQTCRQRKVKCNEERPECMQCTKSGRKCVWDEETIGQLTFRNENVYASGAVTRRKQRSKSKEPLSDLKYLELPAPNQHEQSDDSSREGSLLPLRPPPSVPVETQAVNYYIRNFWTSYNVYFHPLRSQSATKALKVPRIPPKSMIGLSLGAMSLATFGRLRCHPEAISLGRAKYCQALTAMVEAVKSPERARSDQCLLAAKFLCVYEGVTLGLQNTTPYTLSRKHLEGVVALLRIRHADQVLRNRDAVPDRYLRQDVLRAVILHDMPLPTWLENGADFGEEGADIYFDWCFVRVAKLRLRAKQITLRSQDHKLRDEGLERDFEDAVDEALDIDKNFLRMRDSSGKEFAQEEYRPLAGGGGELAAHGKATPFYLLAERTMSWARWCGARLATNFILRRISDRCEMLNLDPADHIAPAGLQAQSCIQDLVAHLCLRAPDLLYHEEFAAAPVSSTSVNGCSPRYAFTLIFPVMVAIACEDCISREQLQQLRDIMLRIGIITGSATFEAFSMVTAALNCWHWYADFLQTGLASSLSEI